MRPSCRWTALSLGERVRSFYISSDWLVRLCRPALRKGCAFPSLRLSLLFLRRGCASPVEAQPQPNKSIMAPPGKAEPFRKAGRQSRFPKRLRLLAEIIGNTVSNMTNPHPARPSADGLAKTPSRSTLSPRERAADVAREKAAGSMRERAASIACLCLALIFGWFVLSPAIGTQTAHAASTPAFNTEIAPILQKNCLACHSSAAKMGGFVMESYEVLMKGGKDGPAIVPGKSEQSRLIQMLEGKVQPRMPFGANPLSASDIAMLKAWIDAGAKGPTAGEANRALAPVTIPDLKPKVPAVSPVVSLKFSPDGAILAIGGYKQVRMIDPSTGKLIRTLDGHADYVRSIVFSSDGKRLFAGGGPPQQWGEIKVWDVATGELLETMRSHKDCIYSLAFSPDGKLVASGSYDKSLIIWDAQTGQELKTLLDHIDAVFAVAFSPDGKLLTSASQDRTVKIWNVASGERLYTLSDALDGITSIAFSPSGEYLAAAGYDNSIHVWRISEREGSLVQSLIADEDSILQIVWSPEGKTLITSSSDGSIRFRDAVTLDPLGVLNNQSDWVDALAISPDGKWLAAGRYDGSLSLYDAKSFKPRLGLLVAFEGSGGESASGITMAEHSLR